MRTWTFKKKKKNSISVFPFVIMCVFNRHPCHENHDDFGD